MRSPEMFAAYLESHTSLLEVTTWEGLNVKPGLVDGSFGSLWVGHTACLYAYCVFWGAVVEMKKKEREETRRRAFWKAV